MQRKPRVRSSDKSSHLGFLTLNPGSEEGIEDTIHAPLFLGGTPGIHGNNQQILKPITIIKIIEHGLKNTTSTLQVQKRPTLRLHKKPPRPPTGSVNRKTPSLQASQEVPWAWRSLRSVQPQTERRASNRDTPTPRLPPPLSTGSSESTPTPQVPSLSLSHLVQLPIHFPVPFPPPTDAKDSGSCSLLCLEKETGVAAITSAGNAQISGKRAKLALSDAGSCSLFLSSGPNQELRSEGQTL